MLASAAAELGYALAECLARSGGAYVLVRTGSRLRDSLRGRTTEYRVNVRVQGQELTITGATPVVALTRAAARLRTAPRKEER
jgi:hypothetical protein